MNLKMKIKSAWKFTNEMGDFTWDEPRPVHELYMPLCNEKGLMSSVTPMLHGDIKTGNDSFLTIPVTMEDLHNTKSARNFWLYITGKGPWSATGNSAMQKSLHVSCDDITERSIESGLLWQRLNYMDREMGLSSSILNFVPLNDNLEIMMVTIKNESNEVMEMTPTSSIPIYARSAENIRDHRHVTSLVNRLFLFDNGVAVKPLIKFNERGHTFNRVAYYVLGSEGDGTNPEGSFPLTMNFIGENGSYEWPEAVVKNYATADVDCSHCDGKEYVGALRFKRVVLEPGDSIDYILLLGITSNIDDIASLSSSYNTSDKVLYELEQVRMSWSNKAGRINFTCGIENFSNWMNWVNIQPVLRKIYGNSFLPYHDYGKGGRGWRDLWQDLLTLILHDPDQVRNILIDNFDGIRIDGTNATIIGHAAGEFFADRNSIPRVWMDHGVWPFMTMKLYIDQTGDFDILLEKCNYFRDAFLHRARKRNNSWKIEDGTVLKDSEGNIYHGSIIEHMLVQHLVSFFNVGEHNMIMLEHADWNDGIDMAYERGESISFTAFYGGNLIQFADLLLAFRKKIGLAHIEIFEELAMLLDSITSDPDYTSVDYKKQLLEDYMNVTNESITGKKVTVSIEELAYDLQKKGEFICSHIRSCEWVKINDNEGFFKSYYDNEGMAVDGFSDGRVRVNLIGQVFTVMYGLATEEQVRESYNVCYKYLKDPNHGGYRLNTPIDNDLLNFGRVLAFAYGEKENGATFNHMVVMYMNALYKRGFVHEAYEVFRSLFDMCLNTENARMYPGIPEYFNPEGKGLYPYLTGSASWMVLTVLQEMFGVKGIYGDLIIQPRLVAEQFDQKGHASVTTFFHDKRFTVIFVNKSRLDYGDYGIIGGFCNRMNLDSFIYNKSCIRIPRKLFLESLLVDNENEILIELDAIDD